MFDTTLSKECPEDKTYWECYWERFAYFYGLDGDTKPEADKFWRNAAWVHLLFANYLMYNSDTIEIPKTRRGIRKLCDDEFSSWRYLANVARWNMTPEIEEFNKNVTRIKTLLSIKWTDVQLYIQYPSNLLMGGFSNVREWYAWAVFVLAWAFRITGSFALLTKAQDMLEIFFNRPDSIPSRFWKTPRSTDEATMQAYSEEVYDFVYTKWITEVKPYLYTDELREVRLFAEEDMKEDNVLFTVGLAVQIGGFKKEEEIDFGKLALNVVAGVFIYQTILQLSR